MYVRMFALRRWQENGDGDSAHAMRCSVHARLSSMLWPWSDALQRCRRHASLGKVKAANLPGSQV